MDTSTALSVVAAGLGGAVGGMYLDSRLSLSRDWHQLSSGAVATFYISRWTWQDRIHLYYRFKDKAKATPHRVCVVFEDKTYTFRQLEKASNRLAHWLLHRNVKKREIVCMMHQNHPTFYIMLFAILKVGAVPALINTNLANEPLLHSIKVANARLLIFDPVFAGQIETVVTTLTADPDFSLFAYGEDTEEAELPSFPFAATLSPSVLHAFTDEDTSEDYLKGVTSSDAAMLIYTSGTTGLPKAAVSQHTRNSFGILMFGAIMGLKPSDRVYIVLPLYHSSGLIVSSLVSFQIGATIVLGRKFSASRFWEECIHHKVTTFTYIGEFCRYLLSQPVHPQERSHRVRMVYGNGLRPDVWNPFRERFGIPKICEFYAATEAPTGLFNVNTGNFGAGSVGHRGPLFRALRRELKIIRIDPVSEEPVRGRDGLCVRCGFDEQGELVVRIDHTSTMPFDGYYQNESASKKKLLRDVFAKGDCYFRSGDLLKMNADGFFFFGDRVGDTFRWKSENVATTEVAQAVASFPGVAEANVYGVEIPHHDGRAGMVAVVLKDDNTAFDLDKLYQHLRHHLPRYAVPVFLRRLPTMELTGTFKQQKVEYRNQGIDLAKIPSTDAVYWVQDDTFKPFTPDKLADLEAGKIKL